MFFCGSDQGVCRPGSMTRPVISPVEAAPPRYPFGGGQYRESQKKLLQVALLTTSLDTGK